MRHRTCRRRYSRSGSLAPRKRRDDDRSRQKRSEDSINPSLRLARFELVNRRARGAVGGRAAAVPVNTDAELPRGHAADLPLSRSAAGGHPRQDDAPLGRSSPRSAAHDRAGLYRVFKTPILTADSPGGAPPLSRAEPYHPGEFYAAAAGAAAIQAIADGVGV